MQLYQTEYGLLVEHKEAERLQAEVDRLKEIITDVGSSGIEWEGNKYTTVQVYADAWRKCRNIAMDEKEQDAREQQTT